MAEHENAQRLRAGYDAFAKMDLEKMNEFIPEGAVWHVTGHSALSGDYTGRDAVYGYFGKLMDLSGGTFKAELVHVLADDEYSTALQRSTGTINGRDVSTLDVLVDRVEGGQAVETWVYFEDDSVMG